MFFACGDSILSCRVDFNRRQGMVSLYVSSHYKNTPDDLMLMSDAPAHHLFVLLGMIVLHTSAISFFVSLNH